MRIVRDLADIPEKARGSSLAIGNFDGLHAGHLAVLAAMHDFADREAEHDPAQAGHHTPRAVLTFAPHPRRFFAPEAAGHTLEPFSLRCRRLAAAGVEWLFCQRFDEAFSQLSAGQFIDEVLRDRLGIAHVATGANFVFGHRRHGDAAFLAAAAHDGGFAYTAVPPAVDEDGVHASSRVRAALKAGDPALASRLLGRPYEMSGRVRRGEQRGAGLGVPTLNLIPPDELLLPAFGIYAVRFCLGEAPLSDEVRWQDGVASLGVRPTFGGGAPWLEVHGFEALGEHYGARLRVRLIHKLRDEEHFASAQALQAQMMRDIDEARAILGPCSPFAGVS